jgi:hypothetical protein
LKPAGHLGGVPEILRTLFILTHTIVVLLGFGAFCVTLTEMSGLEKLKPYAPTWSHPLASLTVVVATRWSPNESSVTDTVADRGALEKP